MWQYFRCQIRKQNKKNKNEKKRMNILKSMVEQKNKSKDLKKELGDNNG